jgi:serine/threonine-protein kinase RsbW
LIRWLPFGLAPERTVYLPKRYRAQIEALYADALLSRSVVESDEGLILLSRSVVESDEGLIQGESELERVYDERRQTLRIAVTRPGSDLADEVGAETREAAAHGGLVAHVDLSLADSATPAASRALRAQGFFFAGLLPEYRDGDVLRMQWLADTVDDTAASILSTDSTRAIEAFVLKDRV